ncbi:MAG: 23S rRNA (adenine(2503)-C(2))-methyltransferase RlmN [Candidatus Cloacimonadia bacterium]
MKGASERLSPFELSAEEWSDVLLNELQLEPKKIKYRVEQICDWLYKKQVSDFESMSNLPQDLRDRLKEKYSSELPKIVRKSVSVDGTKKYLLELTDSSYIEMVTIPEKKKLTLCVSSQVGCARGCAFCATAKNGLKRNLTSSEIIEQVVLAIRENPDRTLTNIVFMGMGEPLDNVVNVIKAVRILQDDRCLSFSPRRITVSTCGVIPGIRKLMESGLKVKLAVSLNAAIQRKREILMPVTKQYPLSDLIEELKYFRANTPFRITFEYVMIKDFNIGREDVKAIIKLLGQISCKLNLISWNETDGSNFKRPSEQEVDQFIKQLHQFSFAVTYRKSRGMDIEAACGQLSARYKQSSGR